MKLVRQSLITVAMLACFSFPALAQHEHEESKKAPSKKEMPEPTKEQREKMAAFHDKMAACLRTDKSMSDCHEEMKKSCSEMGEDSCPMMGHHGMGHMMHKRK